MVIKKLIFSSIIILGLIACTSDSKVIADNGDELYLVQCKDSLNIIKRFDRYCEKYYPTGELRSKYTTRDSLILSGSYRNYYKNGQLQDSCEYLSGFKYGTFNSYYEHGNPKSVEQYVVLDYKDEYLNQYIEYDSITGNVNEENLFTYFFEIKNKLIQEGDSIEVIFEFDNPMYGDSVFLEIGNYDESYMISDTDASNTRIIPVDNLIKTFKFIPSSKKKGENFLRGIIHDFKIDDNSTKERLYYFYVYYEIT